MYSSGRIQYEMNSWENLGKHLIHLISHSPKYMNFLYCFMVQGEDSLKAECLKPINSFISYINNEYLRWFDMGYSKSIAESLKLHYGCINPTAFCIMIHEAGRPFGLNSRVLWSLILMGICLNKFNWFCGFSFFFPSLVSFTSGLIKGTGELLRCLQHCVTLRLVLIKAVAICGSLWFLMLNGVIPKSLVCTL